MGRQNLTYPIAFKGCDVDYINEILDEKDRLISVQERDVESLKREIVDLKKKINYSKRKAIHQFEQVSD